MSVEDFFIEAIGARRWFIVEQHFHVRKPYSSLRQIIQLTDELFF
jgi:hypothetical protein